MRISDWSSDVCSSDLSSTAAREGRPAHVAAPAAEQAPPGIGLEHLVRRFRVQHFIVGELLLDFVQWWRLERNQRLALAAHLFDHSDDRIAVLRQQSHDGLDWKSTRLNSRH